MGISWVLMLVTREKLYFKELTVRAAGVGGMGSLRAGGTVRRPLSENSR